MSRVEPADFQVPQPPVTPIEWQGDWRRGRLRVLDQTRLPRHETVLEQSAAAGVIEDIRRLAVRGAPVIGVAGAYAVVLAARDILREAPALARPAFLSRLREAARPIAEARPTAVNLPAAVERSLSIAEACPGSPDEVVGALFETAKALAAYERDASARIGRAGAAWLHGRRRFLTHCNAGALVTTGIGTALAPIYVLHAAGERVHVWADETRPLLQGMRLTAYELGKAGVSCAVLADGAASGLLRSGEVDAVIVGADRVCANGDVVNKVGTYGLALAAHHHGVPFVVAAPVSTLDLHTARGDDVPIEARASDLDLYLVPDLLPATAQVYGPAFDVTPAELVAALVTEHGTLTKPDAHGIQTLSRAPGDLQADPSPGR
jgi:methylthioribose-1-phosphate isomerase